MMRRRRAIRIGMSLVAAVISAAVFATARADGGAEAKNTRLPEGFLPARASADLPRVARPTQGMQRVHEEIFRPRKVLHGDIVNLSTLPLVEVEPEEKTPATLPKGDAGETFFAKGDLISVSGFEQWILNIEFESAHTGAGLYTGCHEPGWYMPMRGVEYWGVRHAGEKGALELVWAKGYLDQIQCKVAITQRISVRPAHLAGGIAYGFRTHCAGCAAGDRDAVQVITPADDPFEVRQFRMQDERSAGAEMDLPPGSLPSWESWLGPKSGGPAVSCKHRLRLELSQAQAESAPSLWVGCD